MAPTVVQSISGSINIPDGYGISVLKMLSVVLVSKQRKFQFGWVRAWGGYKFYRQNICKVAEEVKAWIRKKYGLFEN